MDHEAERRRQALTKFMATHKLKRGTLARRANISPNIVYNFFKGKSGYLSQPTLERIAQTFNVPISAITGEGTSAPLRLVNTGLGEPGSTGPEAGVGSVRRLPGELTTLKVSGTVLGSVVWSESIFVESDREEFVSFNLPSLYAAKSFAIRLAAPSVDMILPTGALLGCVASRDYLQQIRSGDIVVMVRRNQNGLFQTSVRQYMVEGERHYLVTRSTDPRPGEKSELFSPLSDPAAMGRQDFFIYAVVLSYVADLPAMRR